MKALDRVRSDGSHLPIRGAATARVAIKYIRGVTEFGTYDGFNLVRAFSGGAAPIRLLRGF
jgi:hypothetical protein